MYEPHYEEETGGGGFLIGLLCGTALGAAIGMMFAPKAGSEFRQRLYDSDRRHPTKAYETYDQASEQVNTVASKAVRPSTADGGLRQCPPVSVQSGYRRERRRPTLTSEPFWRHRLQQRPRPTGGV